MKTIAIHRGVLHKILVKKLNAGQLILNKELHSLNSSHFGNKTLEFKDGTKEESKLIIGADLVLCRFLREKSIGLP